MARSPPLNARVGMRLMALLALVLLLHGLGLQWLASHLRHPAALRPLATPMFTRLLQPQAPPAAAALPPPPVVRARPRRSAMTSVARLDAAAAPAPSPPQIPASAAEPPAPLSPAIAQSAASTPQSAVSASSPEGTSTLPAPALLSAPAASAATGSAGVQSAALDSWPADTRLSYRLGGYFRGELHGSARVQWQRQDQRYQNRVEIDINLLASLVLTSQGEVTPQGLVPRIYEELRRSGPRTVRLGEESVTFNDGRTAPRPQGVQDTASQFVELSHRFATGQDILQVGRSVSFWMARPGAVDLWTYDIVEREMLQTRAFGPIEAFRLKPRPIANPRGNITAEMWFAPSLQYLPVRIRVNMGESTYVDLLVEKIEQR